MNAHLYQRVEALPNRYEVATLATCGPAGPQISILSYYTEAIRLHLEVPHGSDHLFNLEGQPALVLLTAGWRLHGRGTISTDVESPYHRQAVVTVTANRLHILGIDGKSTVETIDF